MVILNTERLQLRHFEPEDLMPLYALYRDAEIRKYYPDGTRTLDETKEELDWFRLGHPRHPELGLWTTVERSSGEFWVGAACYRGTSGAKTRLNSLS